MLSIKEINRLSEDITGNNDDTYVKELKLINQAKAYVALVEKIKAEGEEAFTIQPATHLKRFNRDALIAGWNECLDEIKSFIKEQE